MRSIKFKLILSTSAMLLASLVFVSFTILSKQIKTQRRNLAESAGYMMRVVNSEVEEFLATPKTLLSAVEGYVKSTDNIDKLAFENWMEQTVKASNSSVGLLYYTSAVPYKDGGLVAFDIHYTPPADWDQTSRGWFINAKNDSSQAIVMTDPYVDTVTGDLVATLSKAVYKDGKFIGCVGADITMNELMGLVEDFSLSDSGFSYLLDKNGLYITHIDKNRILSSNFFTEQGFENLSGSINTQEGYVNLEAGHGNYLFGCALPKETGWLFVSTGLDSELFREIMAIHPFLFKNEPLPGARSCAPNPFHYTSNCRPCKTLRKKGWRDKGSPAAVSHFSFQHFLGVLAGAVRVAAQHTGNLVHPRVAGKGR